MPMHDWRRVRAGVYHDFHNAWITELRNVLNGGLLPPQYYALGEQMSGSFGPDVLTLHDDSENSADLAPSTSPNDGEGMIAVAEAPPRVTMEQEAEDVQFYLVRRRSVTIRHATGDRVVAIIEIVSPANKHNRQTVDDFVDKIVTALREGIHVMVIDPFPPGRHDVDGMHGAIWERLMAGSYHPPDNSPLTLVSYCVRQPVKAYVEPIRVGSTLADMPLFLTPDHYLSTPLESTCQAAWEGVPARWRRVLEA